MIKRLRTKIAEHILVILDTIFAIVAFEALFTEILGLHAVVAVLAFVLFLILLCYARVGS
jgi:hypothetical protein